MKPVVFALFAIVCSLFFTNEVKAGDLRFDVDGEGVRSISWTPRQQWYDYGDNITVNVVLEDGYMIKSYLNETNNDPKLNSFSFVYDDGHAATMIVNVQTMLFEGFDVTFKVKNGAWNDGTKQDKIKTVWRERGEDKALVLLAADVPAVGSKPDAGYKVGSWDEVPDTTEYLVSSDKTYTYSYVKDETHEYTVAVNADPAKGGTVNASKKSGRTGDEITITASENDGYKFKNWEVTEGGVTLQNAQSRHTTFAIKNANVAVTAHFEERKPGTAYEVLAFGDGHGNAEASPLSGASGTKVTIKATPDEGYKFKEWKVIAGGVDLANSKDAQTTFNIKNADVEVKALFEKKDKKKDDDNDDNNDDDNDDDDDKGDKDDKDHKDDDHEPSNAQSSVNPDAVGGYFIVNGQPLPGVLMAKMKQGPAAQAVFKASCPTGWSEAFTFNIAVNGKLDYTLKSGTLTIIIPGELVKAGRQFALIGLDKNGKAVTFRDIDTDPNTLTAIINIEAYAFDLIYTN